jgi:hypothetical protein
MSPVVVVASGWIRPPSRVGQFSTVPIFDVCRLAHFGSNSPGSLVLAYTMWIGMP